MWSQHFQEEFKVPSDIVKYVWKWLWYSLSQTMKFSQLLPSPEIQMNSDSQFLPFLFKQNSRTISSLLDINFFFFPACFLGTNFLQNHNPFGVYKIYTRTLDPENSELHVAVLQCTWCVMAFTHCSSFFHPVIPTKTSCPQGLCLLPNHQQRNQKFAKNI